MIISDHVSYKEGVKSITARRNGIDNTPGQEEIDNMRFLAGTVFEPMRRDLGDEPIGIASFFRSTDLNERIGGSSNSQHCKGEAMDIDADIYGGITNRQIFNWIKDHAEFDQLIWEFGDDQEPEWVHVSKTKQGNRNEILVAYKNRSQRTKYKYYNA